MLEHYRTSFCVLKIANKEYHISEGDLITVGQKTDAFLHNIQLDEESVSIKHAAIDFRTAKMRIIDLISTTGTYQDDIKLNPLVPYDLTKTCTLKFGNVIGELLIMFKNGMQSKITSPHQTVGQMQAKSTNLVDFRTIEIRDRIENNISFPNSSLIVEDSFTRASHSINDEYIPETQEITINTAQDHSQQFRICTQEFNCLDEESMNSDCFLLDGYEPSILNQNIVDPIEKPNDSKEYDPIAKDDNINNVDPMVIADNNIQNGISDTETEDLSLTQLGNVRKRLSTILSMSESLESDFEAFSPIVVRKSNRLTDSSDDELKISQYITIRRRARKRNYLSEYSDEEMEVKSPVDKRKTSTFEDHTSTRVGTAFTESNEKYTDIEGNKENNRVPKAVADFVRNSQNHSSTLSENEDSAQKVVKRKTDCIEKIDEESQLSSSGLERRNVKVQPRHVSSESSKTEEMLTVNNKKSLRTRKYRMENVSANEKDTDIEGNKENNRVPEAVADFVRNSQNHSSTLSENEDSAQKVVKRKTDCIEKIDKQSQLSSSGLERRNVKVQPRHVSSESSKTEEMLTVNNKKSLRTRKYRMENASASEKDTDIEGNKENNRVPEAVADFVRNSQNHSSTLSENEDSAQKVIKRETDCIEKIDEQSQLSSFGLERRNVNVQPRHVSSESSKTEEMLTVNNKKSLRTRKYRMENVSSTEKGTRLNLLPLNSIKNRKNTVVASDQCEDNNFEKNDLNRMSLRKRGGVTKKMVSDSCSISLQSNLKNSTSTSVSHSLSLLSGSNLTVNLGNMTLRKKTKIVFSQGIAEDYMEDLSSLGIQVVTDPKLAEVLITDKVKRTYKFLIAVVRGIPILSQKWLEQSISKNSILPYDGFYIKDEDFENQFEFELNASIKSAQNRKIFAGYKFLLTKNIKPAQKEMIDLIECGGGKVLRNMSKDNISEENVFLVSDIKDKLSLKKIENNFTELKIIQGEGILTSILRQSIQFEKYLLK